MDTTTSTTAGITIAAFAAALVLYKLTTAQGFKSDLARLQCPKADSFVLGHLPIVISGNDVPLIESWIRDFGSTFTIHGFLSKRRLFTIDTTALCYVLTKASDFPRGWQAAAANGSLTGPGLLAVGGETHRRQVCHS